MVNLASKKFVCSFSSVDLLRISWFKFAMFFFFSSFLQLSGRVRWSATADGVLTGVWREPSRGLCWCSCHLHRGHLQPDVVADSVWMGKGAQLLLIAARQNTRFLTLAIIKTFWIKELLHPGRGRNCGETFDCKMKARWRLSGVIKIQDISSKRMPFHVPKQYLIYFAFLFVYYLFLELHLHFHYSHQGCDGARETTCPRWGSQNFQLVWGCCVLFESTAVALSSHTGEEFTLA